MLILSDGISWFPTVGQITSKDRRDWSKWSKGCCRSNCRRVRAPLLGLQERERRSGRLFVDDLWRRHRAGLCQNQNCWTVLHDLAAVVVVTVVVVVVVGWYFVVADVHDVVIAVVKTALTLLEEHNNLNNCNFCLKLFIFTLLKFSPAHFLLNGYYLWKNNCNSCKIPILVEFRRVRIHPKLYRTDDQM